MEFSVTTKKRVELINITEEVQTFLTQINRSELSQTVTLFVPHTTAAVTINESADPSVVNDLESAFKQLVPNITFEHMEGNSPAHLLSTLIGPSMVVPIANQQLDLGRWQGIFFCEFDGPRQRKIKLLR